MARLLYGLSTLLLVLAPSTADACVGTLSWFETTSSSQVSLTLDTSGLDSTTAGALDSALDSGIQMWQGNCPNYGSDFPTLAKGGTGDLVIAISYYDSVSTQALGRCGEFDFHAPDGTLSGGTINLWREQSDGRDCWGPDGMLMAGIMAHEIGHVLGLDESTCTDHLMGSITATVQEAECQQAGGNYETLEEQTTDPKDDQEPAPKCEISPILIDLEMGELRLSSAEDGTFFDIDADRRDERVAWPIAGEQAGFLFLDRNGNGFVDDGSELFGEYTLQPPSDSPHGFSALAVFDTPIHGGDADGSINGNDAIYPDLRLWIDEDRNGWSAPGEIQSLAAAGILEIDLQFVTSGRRDQHGNLLRYVSKALHVDGRLRFAIDAYLLVASDP